MDYTKLSCKLCVSVSVTVNVVIGTLQEGAGAADETCK